MLPATDKFALSFSRNFDLGASREAASPYVFLWKNVLPTMDKLALSLPRNFGFGASSSVSVEQRDGPLVKNNGDNVCTM